MTIFDWLVSKKAYALFRYSAWVVVYTVTFMAFMLTPLFRPIDTMPTGKLILQIIAFPAAVLGAPSSLFIIIGMAFHCLSNCDLSIGTKVFWSIFAFLTAPLGAAIYFFTVYKKQMRTLLEQANG